MFISKFNFLDYNKAQYILRRVPYETNINQKSRLSGRAD